MYVSPDGAQHRFWELLHLDDQPSVHGDWSYQYTRDSSYLRMKFRPDSDTVRYIEHPDGTIYSFFKYDSVNNKWRLESIEDRFNNSILFDYGVDPESGRTMWTIDDGHREQKVCFTTRLVEGIDVEYVAEIELSASGGSTASYVFSYTDTQIARNGQHNDPDVGSEDPWVPLLTNLELPDGSSYSMSYYPSIGTVPDRPGVIRKLILPTGGAMQWSYQTCYYSGHAREDMGSCVPNACYDCIKYARALGLPTSLQMGQVLPPSAQRPNDLHAPHYSRYLEPPGS
jgi:hypothetical protein